MLFLFTASLPRGFLRKDLGVRQAHLGLIGAVRGAGGLRKEVSHFFSGLALTTVAKVYELRLFLGYKRARVARKALSMVSGSRPRFN